MCTILYSFRLQHSKVLHVHVCIVNSQTLKQMLTMRIPSIRSKFSSPYVCQYGKYIRSLNNSQGDNTEFGNRTAWYMIPKLNRNNTYTAMKKARSLNCKETLQNLNCICAGMNFVKITDSHFLGQNI